jgi:hypothetical protein
MLCGHSDFSSTPGPGEMDLTSSVLSKSCLGRGMLVTYWHVHADMSVTTTIGVESALPEALKLR